MTSINQLEDILLPGEANLGNMIANFFDGLQEISASPADLATRVAAMERGKTVANTFNQLAQLTSELKDGLETIERISPFVTSSTTIEPELSPNVL